MTLDQLRVFVAVAERQHVTRAAEALHMTQSAVSGALAALEGRYDVKLFDRVGRSVVLNEVGRALLTEAKAVLARVEGVEATLADLSAVRRGRVTIHASQTIASYWLPKRVVAFQAAHPQVELVVEVGNTRDVVRAVTEGAAELGFVEGAADGDVLSSEVVGEDRLFVLARPDHAWASREPLGLADLYAQRWVLREVGSGTRSTLETAVRAWGGDPARLNVSLSLPSNEAVLSAAEAGGGVTALSESVAVSALLRGALIRANYFLPSRQYRLLRHKERYRTRAGEAFVALASTIRDVSFDDDYMI